MYKNLEKINSISNIEFEVFNKEKSKSLMLKWKKSYDSICNSLKWI
jgi:hypothetical protein